MLAGTKLRVAIPCAAAGLLVAFLAPSLQAQATYTWANSGSDWNTVSDWTGGSVPGSADTALFILGTYNFQPNLSAASQVSGVWDTGGGAVAISGSALTLFGTSGINGNAATGLEMDPGAGSLTISAAVALGAAQTWLNNSSPAGGLALSGSVANGGNTLTISGSGNTVISSVLSGAGGLTVQGSGLVTLSSINNTYNGTTTINGGTLAVANWGNSNSPSALGEGANIVFNGGALLYEGDATNNASYSRTLTINASGGTIMNTGGSYFWPSAISGSGNLTVISSGGTSPQFLSGGSNVSYTGTITVLAGELQARSSLAYGSGTIILNGGEFGATMKQNASLIANSIDILSNPPVGPALEFHDVLGTPTLSGTITLGNSACGIGAGNGNNATSVTISGLITGSGGLNLLEYSGGTGANAPVYIAGNQSNNYTGPTLLTGSLQGLDAYLYLADTGGAYALSGTNIQFAAYGRAHLAIGAAGQQFSPSAVLTFSGTSSTDLGYLQLEGNSQTVGGLNCSTGYGIVEASESSSLASASLTLDGNGTYLYNGILRDHNSGSAALSLIAAGSGMQTLAGSNSYSGGTFIDSGTLQLGNLAALGSGGLAANGGTLDLAGFGITVPSFSGAAGTITDSSSAAGATLLTVNESVSATFGGSIQTGPAGRQVSLVQTGPGSLTLSGTNTVASAIVLSGGTLQIAGSLTAGTVSIDNAATLGGGGLISVGGGGWLYYLSTADSTYAGTIAGSGGIEVESGSLTLSGSDTFTGGTAVTGGTLIVADSEALAGGSRLIVGNAALLFAQSIPSPAAALQSSITPVPEPATLALLAAALCSAAIYRRFHLPRSGFSEERLRGTTKQ